MFDKQMDSHAPSSVHGSVLKFSGVNQFVI